VKIQSSVTQVWDTLAVDKKLHPIPFHYGVAVLFLIERHLVLQTRTAAFCNLNTQALPGIFSLRCKQNSELSNSVVRNVNHPHRKYGTGLPKSKSRECIRFGFPSQFVRQNLEFKIA